MRKVVAFLLTGVMATSLLVGCGSSDTGTTNGEGTGTTPETTTTEGTESEGSSTANSGSLVYWSMWSDGEVQATVIKEAAEQFEAETGIVVDVQFKGRAGIREGLQPALEANQQIDIFDEAVDRVNIDWGKYLYNLEDLVPNYEANHGNEALFKISRDLHSTGELHSIPYQPTTFGFFYNKTLFDQAGITTEPTTWEEFDEVCQKLLDIGVAPITMDDAYATANIGLHLGRYIGEEDVIKLVNGDGVTWDDPRVVAAIEDYADFQAKGYFSSSIATNAFPAGQNQEFAPGFAAMNLNGAWLPNETKNFLAADFEWGFFNYPEVQNGQDPITTNYLAAQVFAINVNCTMPEEAFQFIEYITTGAVDMQMVEAALVIPTDKANTEWPTELAAVKKAYESTTDSYIWAAGVESNGDITPILKDNTIRLMSGAMTADEFIVAMSAAY